MNLGDHPKRVVGGVIGLVLSYIIILIFLFSPKTAAFFINGVANFLATFLNCSGNNLCKDVSGIIILTIPLVFLLIGTFIGWIIGKARNKGKKIV
ncbi:MAG: hypothetical protein WC781_02950 [Candidatus Pacearchaeota archaeon]|jgi:hypothetical protein